MAEKKMAKKRVSTPENPWPTLDLWGEEEAVEAAAPFEHGEPLDVPMGIPDEFDWNSLVSEEINAIDEPPVVYDSLESTEVGDAPEALQGLSLATQALKASGEAPWKTPYVEQLTAPANYSPLARLLIELLERLRRVEGKAPLSDWERFAIEHVANRLNRAVRQGSVSCLMPTEGSPWARPVPWRNGETVSEVAMLEALEAIGLLGRASDYEARRLRHAGWGLAEGPFVAPRPLLLDNADATDTQRLYLTRFYDEERRLAKALMAHAQSTFALTEAQRASVESVCTAAGCDADQAAAIVRALENGLVIVSGGPGTGKTRTVGVLLSLLERSFPSEKGPLRCYLAAPTGKATGRLRESMDALLSPSNPIHTLLANLADPSRITIEERTIHKWLVTPTQRGLRPGPEAPLDCDVLVIDEASMMDSHLAMHLFEAVSPETRMVILGDKHQLAAVGPGSVFADISEPDGPLAANVQWLRTSHRFKTGGLIDQVARLINQDDATPEASAKANTRQLIALLGRSGARDSAGYEAWWHETPALEALTDEAEQRFFRLNGLTPAEKAWIDRYIERYWQALQPLLDATTEAAWQAAYQELKNVIMSTRALAAQRKGAHSVMAINDYFTNELLDRLEAGGYFASNRTYDTMGVSSTEALRWQDFPGRLIIVRKNSDRLGVYNGDVAVIVPRWAPDPADRVWVADFLDDQRTLRPVLLPLHETAFAMTIHQSQGSDFMEVGVFLPSADRAMLASRELLYTGVTRTKRVVHLFGTEAMLALAMKQAMMRTSGLRSRLKECA